MEKYARSSLLHNHNRLLGMLQLQRLVLRDGVYTLTNFDEIVVGDVVSVQSGDLILHASLWIIDGKATVSQYELTGEREGVERGADAAVSTAAIDEYNLSYAAKNMLLDGVTVLRTHHCIAVVMAIGEDTFWHRLASHCAANSNLPAVAAKTDFKAEARLSKTVLGSLEQDSKLRFAALDKKQRDSVVLAKRLGDITDILLLDVVSLFRTSPTPLEVIRTIQTLLEMKVRVHIPTMQQSAVQKACSEGITPEEYEVILASVIWVNGVYRSIVYKHMLDAKEGRLPDMPNDFQLCVVGGNNYTAHPLLALAHVGICIDGAVDQVTKYTAADAVGLPGFFAMLPEAIHAARAAENRNSSCIVM
jgi:magnesium-transporting ATPase (P-type)